MFPELSDHTQAGHCFIGRDNTEQLSSKTAVRVLVLSVGLAARRRPAVFAVTHRYLGSSVSIDTFERDPNHSNLDS